MLNKAGTAGTRAPNGMRPKSLELQNRAQIRFIICVFLLLALGFSIVCFFGLILLNGFHTWGFHMDDSFVKWLCGATIAQVAVILGIFARAVWQNPIK
jgi:hypothetical protein